MLIRLISTREVTPHSIKKTYSDVLRLLVCCSGENLEMHSTMKPCVAIGFNSKHILKCEKKKSYWQPFWIYANEV